GSKTKQHSGIYGTKGVPDPNNVPGARRYAVSWIDSENNLYLFGGSVLFYSIFLFIYCFYCCLDYLNDLWKFDGTNWTWLSGSNTTKQRATFGKKGVPHPDNVPGARHSAVSWIDSKN